MEQRNKEKKLFLRLSSSKLQREPAAVPTTSADIHGSCNNGECKVAGDELEEMKFGGGHLLNREAAQAQFTSVAKPSKIKKRVLELRQFGRRLQLRFAATKPPPPILFSPSLPYRRLLAEPEDRRHFGCLCRNTLPQKWLWKLPQHLRQCSSSISDGDKKRKYRSNWVEYSTWTLTY